MRLFDLLKVSYTLLLQKNSGLQTSLHLRWSPRWAGGCGDHLLLVVGPRPVWRGRGASQRAGFIRGPEDHDQAQGQPAPPSTGGPVAQHQGPPIQRSAGPRTRLLVPRSVPFKQTHTHTHTHIYTHTVAVSHVFVSSAPHSFTGEDSVEFHLHGGPAVITAVLRALGRTQKHLRL